MIQELDVCDFMQTRQTCFLVHDRGVKAFSKYFYAHNKLTDG